VFVVVGKCGRRVGRNYMSRNFWNMAIDKLGR
jgi:hypothetical protein